METNTLLPIQERVRALKEGPEQFFAHTDKQSIKPEELKKARDNEALLEALRVGKQMELKTEDARNLVVGMTTSQLPQIPGCPLPVPKSASLWGLFQNNTGAVGGNAALTALGSRFNGLSGDGYVDLGPNVGLDYSASVAPGGAISGEIELEGTVLTGGPFQAPLTVTHRLMVQQEAGKASARHAASLSSPVWGGSGRARLRVWQHSNQEQRPPAACLELTRKNKTRTELKAATAPRGNDKNSNNGSESEPEDMPSSPPLPGAQNGLRMPLMKLEVAPQSYSSGLHESLALRWQQGWGKSLCSTASYQGSSKRLQMNARAGVWPGVRLGTSVAWDGKDQEVRQASVRLQWRPQPAWPGSSASRSLVLESRVNRGAGGVAGVTHAVKVRRRPWQRGGGVEASASVQHRQGSGRVSFKFDVYLPL